MAEPLQILHNTACSTSRHAVDAACDVGAGATVRQYLKDPLTREELLDLLEILEDEPADLVRKDGFFVDRRLDPEDYTTPEQVAGLLVQHPRLMQRPVLVRGRRAIIGRPKDRVQAFLQG